ncbi:hypothetical protein EON81_15765 [bacterium]|nr:MAG: hypothetical protein EON81_15765 [bacterium]
MALILQLLGAITLVLLLLIFGIFISVKGRASQMRRMALAMGGPVPPIRVHLSPMSEAPWKDKRAYRKWREEALALGLEPVGEFRVEPARGTHIALFIDTTRNAYVEFTEHMIAGVGAGVGRSEEEGRLTTISNSRLNHETESPPWRLRIWMPEAPLAEMLAKLDEFPPESPPISLDRGNAPGRLEEEYHRLVRWRYEEGKQKVPNLEQLERLAKFAGVPIDPQTEAYLRGRAQDS